MTRVYSTTKRPARTAKLARAIWDEVTVEDGVEPKELSLCIWDGRWRDWFIIHADGRMTSIEAGIAFVAHHRVRRPL